MNPELKEQIDGLQSSIKDNADKQQLPKRFICEMTSDTVNVIITDTETGKTSTVPLFAMAQVRKTLNNLFG